MKDSQFPLLQTCIDCKFAKAKYYWIKYNSEWHLFEANEDRTRYRNHELNVDIRYEGVSIEAYAAPMAWELTQRILPQIIEFDDYDYELEENENYVFYAHGRHIMQKESIFKYNRAEAFARLYLKIKNLMP